jgi:hypothetical protein
LFGKKPTKAGHRAAEVPEPFPANHALCQKVPEDLASARAQRGGVGTKEADKVGYARVIPNM